MSEPGAGEAGARGLRFLGVPLLFAVAYSAVGFSLYFSLGLVAERGLGLTPLIFLGVGLMFLLNTLTYVEGEAMVPERGGSATFARAAFKNELVSFVAGWAILIDYVIVIALAAISVPHYLTPISSGFADSGGEIAAAVVVILLIALLAVAGFTGVRRERLLGAISLAGVALLAAVIVVGLVTSFDLDVLTTDLDPFDSFANPTLRDLIYAGVIATVAFAGIEAAANLAPDLRARGGELRTLVVLAAALIPIAYVGVAVVGLMALPVESVPGGHETPLGEEYLENPLLGIVQSFDPTWVADVMEAAVVAVVPAALVWAGYTAMLGLSRHVYVLAKNRQIPSWLGKLNDRWRTPHVAIAIAAVVACALVVPTDVELLGGLFAFGATIAFTIAHVSILRMRVTEPDARRPFRIPLDISVAGARLPLPTLVATALTALAWVSVVAFHESARWVGGGWMLFGLVAYVIYRRVVEGTGVTQRLEVPESALVKELPKVEYAHILVPIFGTRLDDDIVGTAGRLAVAARRPADEQPLLTLVSVLEVPLTTALNAPPPTERMEQASRAIERAAEVAEEYETVEVKRLVVRARRVGAGIVETARDLGVEAIVMGGEPTSAIKGGYVLGGKRGNPPQIGPVTEYVLRRAPCPVLITAPVKEGADDSVNEEAADGVKETADDGGGEASATGAVGPGADGARE